MPLKKSKGNMYDWISHTHTHLGGECPHRCSYCYVNSPRFGRPAKYRGPLKLMENEFNVQYKEGRTIFIENCNDLFSEYVSPYMIKRVLEHCNAWPKNTYVFQTKNPKRYSEFLDLLPKDSILGTTIETNRTSDSLGKAPEPLQRYLALGNLKPRKLFITIEPIVDFDVDTLGTWITDIRPEFVNIGADSKGHGLQEPSAEKINALIEFLQKNSIEIREKHNLERILNPKK
nr:hypothetical protein 17 [Candidatus Omnitrophota bacterium]